MAAEAAATGPRLAALNPVDNKHIKRACANLLGDLLLCNEHKWVIQLTLHALGVCDEVGGDVAPVKLHALNYFKLVL